MTTQFPKGKLMLDTDLDDPLPTIAEQDELVNAKEKELPTITESITPVSIRDRGHK